MVEEQDKTVDTTPTVGMAEKQVGALERVQGVFSTPANPSGGLQNRGCQAVEASPKISKENAVVRWPWILCPVTRSKRGSLYAAKG